MSEPINSGREYELGPIEPPSHWRMELARPRDIPIVTAGSFLSGALVPGDFDCSGELTTDFDADAIGYWMKMFLAPVEQPARIPPFTHTLVPGEPTRRRWWQFWRRSPSVWPTYTLTHDRERRWFGLRRPCASAPCTGQRRFRRAPRTTRPR